MKRIVVHEHINWLMNLSVPLKLESAIKSWDVYISEDYIPFLLISTQDRFEIVFDEDNSLQPMAHDKPSHNEPWYRVLGVWTGERRLLRQYFYAEQRQEEEVPLLA